MPRRSKRFEGRAETAGHLRSSKAAVFTMMESPDMPVAPSHDTSELPLHRIRGEYLEMPGLRLTLAQAKKGRKSTGSRPL